MEPVDVSVVVCTFNRAELLRGTLESVSRLVADGFRYEVLVIDNGSTDATPQVIAEAARGNAAELRGVRETRPGVSAARNRGIAEARGQWIAFLDDDELADPRWLAELMAAAAQTQAWCVSGPCRPLLPQHCPPHLVPMFRELMQQTPPQPTLCRFKANMTLGTANLLIHRRVFQQVGVFDETLREAGEDTDLYRRIRQAQIEVWYAPDAVVDHIIPASRIEVKYLRWAGYRTGWVFARRDLREHGYFGLVWRMAARIGHALLVRFPRLAWARLRGDEATALGLWCRLWLNEAYLRGGLQMLAPRLFPQRAFESQLNFRLERKTPAEESAKKETEAVSCNP